jgi:hypothetical protein
MIGVLVPLLVPDPQEPIRKRDRNDGEGVIF